MFFRDEDKQKMIEILINVLAIRNRIGEKGEQVMNDSLQEELTSRMEKDALKRDCQLARIEGQLTAITEYLSDVHTIHDEIEVMKISFEEKLDKLSKSVKPPLKKRKSSK
jgi:DNA-binding FrmR family transcriptional regulator